MDKEILENSNRFEGLTSSDIHKKLYGKELDCKKHILEYIDVTKVLKKENVSGEQIKDTYNYIYDHIEGIKDKVKPNTMMYLKNGLKTQLGKYVKDKDPKQVNHFIEFFKEAYPEKNRRKDFTWVLMDINSITEEQIWTTLTYINRECMNNDLRLGRDQKNDIIEVVEKLIKKNNIKYINSMRSLRKLTDILKINIISDDEGFRVKRLR